LVDSAGTRRRVQALVTIGWPQARIAAEAGMSPSNFGQTLQRERVYAGTARTVRRIYDRLWNTLPDESDRHSRAGIARARNYAAERGWVPPLAWGDDAIDDPARKPADGWKRPARARLRSADLAEDAEELFRREGYTREHAAERLGVSLSALEMALRRTQQAREHEHEAERARFAEASAAAAAEHEAEAG
jgi:transcriptional regulator with XRE-family HTH domain